MTSQLDLIVCTKDRPADLTRLLRSLAGQSGVDFRCTIVDQSIEPELNRSQIEELSDERFSHLTHDDVGKSRALNFGLRSTSAPIVAFTDDDCEVPAGWLARAMTVLEDGDGVAFGNVEAAEHNSETEFIPSIEFASDDRLSPSTIRLPTLLGMGANMVVRREVFSNCGGFEESLGPGGRFRTGEDCEFALRALRHGYSVRRVNSWAVVHHGSRPTNDGIASKHVIDGFYAIGVGYGKHLRGGEGVVLVVVAIETWRRCIEILSRVLRREPHIHVRPLLAFWSGIAVGFRTKLEAPAVHGQLRTRSSGR